LSLGHTIPSVAATIPVELHDLLRGSDLESPTLAFAEKCEEILKDNKLPFFPAYTDHGSQHVQGVMESVVRLIPGNVLEGELLSPPDGALIVAACYLHDLAMHLRAPSFVALISDGTDFTPLPWFDEPQRSRPPDLPWPETWQDFRKKAKRFSESDFERLLGPGFAEAPSIAWGDKDLAPETWTQADYLLVGEFLRRHHARLAHEIAHYGLPDIPSTEFPALKDLMPTLADHIGSTARSHNEDLRVAFDYLEHKAPGDLRPDGAVVHYAMGLLRVADYLQIEAGRATPLLLHLRRPQSPLSIDEWKKHQAVSGISWDTKDPRAARVTITPAHTLRIHLQLRELLEALQREVDVTTAVLRETYGASTLAALTLTLERVNSNLDEPALHRELAFVPVTARLRSAEDLFRLVVGDLYGQEPAVAGRELLQNAIDAVRELARRSERLGTDPPGDLRDLGAEVLVEVRQLEGGRGVLTVADRGVGMTPETIVSSFLAAGSSFRESFEEDESQTEVAAVRWMKAGRFGIGVLASFLLGTEVRVATRHAGAQRGVTFAVTMDDDLVEMNWTSDLPIGTELSIPFRVDTLPLPFGWEGDYEERYTYFLEQIAIHYQISDPEVKFIFRNSSGTITPVDRVAEVPLPGDELPFTWRSLEVPDLDAVFWSLPRKDFVLDGFVPSGEFGNRIAHNGFVIRKPADDSMAEAYEWAAPAMTRLLRCPSIAAFDTLNRLGISLNRYELASRTLDFEDILLRSIGRDVVAHAITSGTDRFPLSYQWGLSPISDGTRFLPLMPALCDRYLDGALLVFWTPDSSVMLHSQSFLEIVLDAAGWDELPFRVELKIDEFVEDDDLQIAAGEDLEEDDPDHERIEVHTLRSTLSLARLLRCNPVGAVFKSEAGLTTKLKIESSHPDVMSSLTEAADEIHQLGLEPPFGLAVLRPGEGTSSARDEPLAEAWIEIIGGMLERAPDARLEREDQVADDHGDLMPLLRSWERYRELPGWDDESSPA